MVVVRMRVAWLLRKFLRATVFLALGAGLSGGLALTAWLSGRRATEAPAQFLAMADPPELQVVICPPDVESLTSDVDLLRCFAHKPIRELEVLRSLPGVSFAGRMAYQPADATLGGKARRITIYAIGDPGLVTPAGQPIVVRGRLADADAPAEIVVNEAAARTAGLRLGDHVEVRWLAPDDVGHEGPASGPRLSLQIVGIVRAAFDLAASLSDGAAEAAFMTGPGTWRAVEDEAWLGYTSIAVQVARSSDAGAVESTIRSAFPGRVVDIEPTIGVDDTQPGQEAFGYEAKAAFAFAALTGLAAVVFVGQAIGRQVRREWADLSTLRALGLSRGQACAAAAARGAVIGLGAALVAGCVVVVLAERTPVGAARAARLHLGLQTDAVVLAVGLPIVVLLTTVVAWFPVRRLSGRRNTTGERSRLAGVPTGALLPPSGMAGVDMAVNGGRGSTGLGVGMAVSGLALAAAVVVAAVALGASLHGLVATPSRYGATWDVSIRTPDAVRMEELADEVPAVPGVGAASSMLGLQFELDGESTWTIALEPIPGIATAIAPTLTEGRAPTRADEIAVGALTQQSIGKRVGDRVLLTTAQAPATPSELTIVGTVVMNAIDEGSPGFGAVVAPALMHELAPEEAGDAIVVELADGADGEAARSVIEHDLAVDGIMVDPPRRQTAILNVERIRSLPGLLAGVVALLAAACLAHALATSVRRNRAELAVFKALGFTPRQVSAAVAWEACALALVALLIGVPAGLALATWGWRAVADRLGLESPTIVPIAQVAVVALALIAVANVVAIWPGRRAARLRPGAALRAE